MNDEDLKKKMQERFLQLPRAVRESITSADIEKRLRELATVHQLHVDQWDTLENEVMLTILGFDKPENLESNIRKQIGMAPQEARSLAESINDIVFEPIRRELERQLEHPAAEAKEMTGLEEAREHILGSSNGAEKKDPPSVAAPLPPTPPQPQPQTTVVRMPASGAYKPGEASTVRASIVDDPYREAPK